eukprot:8443455-Lingulodinium_polyedra.AAC.1
MTPQKDRAGTGSKGSGRNKDESKKAGAAKAKTAKGKFKCWGCGKVVSKTAKDFSSRFCFYPCKAIGDRLYKSAARLGKSEWPSL